MDNLKPRRETFAGDGREFLRTPRGLRYKTAGGTLNAALFTGTVIKGGTAVYLGADGLFAPWPADGAVVPAGATATAALTAHSVNRIEGQNPLCGFIVAGHPLRDRCTGVTPAFEDATRNRLIFDL